jgi:glycosyltransferase involved in cell wall biosynthesis
MTYGKCFFGGCVYNCEKHLKNVIENIHKMGTVFDEYAIIVAYDKSDDKSLDILREEASKFKNFHLLINNSEKSHIRTQNISNARNAILTKIRELHTDEWEYFSMVDMDDVCDFPLNMDTVHNVLKRYDWDSVSFNRKLYYDIWALSVEPYLFSCWNWTNSHSVVEKTKKYIELILSELDRGELLEVRSAFNGIAFYRCAKFLNCNYDWTTCKKYITNEEFKKNIEATKETPFIRIYNDDCEHRSFHMEAIEKNGARIRITPLSLFIE